MANDDKRRGGHSGGSSDKGSSQRNEPGRKGGDSMNRDKQNMSDIGRKGSEESRGGGRNR